MFESERKFKDKIKNWNFRKYLTISSTNVIEAKMNNRKANEGKETRAG
jgi:glutathione peroxidase-family protein